MKTYNVIVAAALLAAGCAKQMEPTVGGGPAGKASLGSSPLEYAYQQVVGPACLIGDSATSCKGAATLTAAQLGDATACPQPQNPVDQVQWQPFMRADGTLLCQRVLTQRSWVVPSDDGREPIDEANKATRLHPDLKGAYMKYDATITAGESDRYVFASQWWPQSENGIAWRWVPGADQDYTDTASSDDLSPAEKYDLLFHAGQKTTVRCSGKTVTKDDGSKVCQNWSWRDMQKPEDQRGSAYEQTIVEVAGPTTAWEMANHGKYQGTQPDSWWGHCNGWSAYATSEAGGFPKCDIRVKNVNGQPVECAAGEAGCVLLRMGDIEALLTEVHFSDSATFSGRRCNVEPDDIKYDDFGRPEAKECRDINAGTFHAAVTGLLGKGAKPLSGSGAAEKLPFVIDHNWDFQVWNFPLTKFQIDEAVSLSEAEAQKAVTEDDGDSYTFNPNATQFVKIKMTYWMVSDGVSASKMLKRADQRGVSAHDNEMNYVLELDSQNKILGGEWVKEDPSFEWGTSNKKAHPDFLWMGIKAQGWGESADDTGGSDDNPFVSYKIVKKLLEIANTSQTCGGNGGGGNGGGGNGGGGNGGSNICAGVCGGQAASGCYCDSSCVEQDTPDCCMDDSGTQGDSLDYILQECDENEI